MDGCRCYFWFTFLFELETFQWLSKCSELFIGKNHLQATMIKCTCYGWFNGYVCHFPFNLSFISRPDTLRTLTLSIARAAFPSLPVWLELCSSSASLSSCSSRIISSSGWQSTWECHRGPHQVQQVLPCVDRKRSVFRRSGTLSCSQNIHEWPFEGLSNFWECGSKVLKADTNWCRDASAFTLSQLFWCAERFLFPESFEIESK